MGFNSAFKGLRKSAKTLKGEVGKGTARKTSTKKYEKKGTKIENETKKKEQTSKHRQLTP